MTDAAQPTVIRAPRCPLCGKLSEAKYRPFCSAHCADLDLSRWLNGVYAVPARDEDEGDGQHSDDFHTS